MNIFPRLSGVDNLCEVLKNSRHSYYFFGCKFISFDV